MNREILKKLFEIKMELVEEIIDQLPEGTQIAVRKMGREMMEVVVECVSDYLEKHSVDEDGDSNVAGSTNKGTKGADVGVKAIEVE